MPARKTKNPTRKPAARKIQAAVLGADVSQSRSPEIHGAAFKALRVKGTYGAISLAGDDFNPTVRSLFDQGFRYVNVTIPHKRLAAKLADTQSQAVAMTGAANTLVARGKKIHADNTDGDGILAALGDLQAPIKRGSRVIMVGAGGAAAGALLALTRKGAEVTLLARRPAQASGLKRRLPENLRARVKAGKLTPATLGRALANAQVLISAVPAAAWDDDQWVPSLQHMNRNTAVVEMAYGKTTPLARAVRKHTSRYQDGIPMLVHQAAVAVKVALGKLPPTDPLFRAVARR